MSDNCLIIFLNFLIPLILLKIKKCKTIKYTSIILGLYIQALVDSYYKYYVYSISIKINLFKFKQKIP